VTAVQELEREEVEDKKKDKPDKAIMWVKKNLIDPTASLSYCLGVSIIHLSISITLLFVPIVDLEKAKGLP
jgi:hypothetical protein